MRNEKGLSARSNRYYTVGSISDVTEVRSNVRLEKGFVRGLLSSTPQLRLPAGVQGYNQISLLQLLVVVKHALRGLLLLLCCSRTPHVDATPSSHTTPTHGTRGIVSRPSRLLVGFVKGSSEDKKPFVLELLVRFMPADFAIPPASLLSFQFSVQVCRCV